VRFDIIAVGVAFLLATTAAAQEPTLPPSGGPAFEVASVKPTVAGGVGP
jgi:hypothetical protein